MYDTDDVSKDLHSLTYYHGTDIKSATSIVKNGVKIAASGGGYFGVGFYVTPDKELARTNYAEFTGATTKPALLELTLKSDAKIIDLRSSDHWLLWRDTIATGKAEHDPLFYKTAPSKGCDAVYDRSFGGLCIYNNKIISSIKIL